MSVPVLFADKFCLNQMTPSGKTVPPRQSLYKSSVRSVGFRCLTNPVVYDPRSSSHHTTICRNQSVSGIIKLLVFFDRLIGFRFL